MKSVFGLLLLVLALSCARPVAAQEGALETTQPNGTTPKDIIKLFADKESEFAKARDQYTYRQSVKVETLNGETIDGMYQETFDVMFDDKGHRIKNGVFARARPWRGFFLAGEEWRHSRPR